MNQSRLRTIYFFSISTVGIALVALSAFHVRTAGLPFGWMILAYLTAVTSSFTVKIPGVNSKISVADTFIFTNIILFGIDAGALTAAMDGILGSLRSRSRIRRLRYLAFNTGAMAICVHISGRVFFFLMQRTALFQHPDITLRQILPPLASMAVVHYLANSGIVAGIVALEQWTNTYRVWRESYLWTSITYFTGATVAGLIALNASSITPPVLGAITPILVIIYFTHKTYLGKVENSIQHLKELNKLYLDTVETLAMAIDAKDQVTHGHVRRVQVQTRGLALALGMTNENELRGLEAAALLHDIGKLAIPEYILNKPGELSRSEFQKMMIHPAVGGDILASINFPYPIADYVRHHHERWDGTGYPDKLKGTQIPLGARVLAVVDCYDALTCDRPYRAGYTRERAMEIIRARAGTHYDPEVVRKFEENLDSLIKEAAEIEFHELHVPGLNAITASAKKPERSAAARSRDPHVFQNISSSHREVLALWELAQNLGSTLDLHETLPIIASKMEKIIPFTTCVIYLPSPSNGSLTAAHISGENAEVFRGHAMEIGENLSGWVAANNQPAVNADPVFDLMPLKGELQVELRNALVYPLSFENQCLGTISLYGAPGIHFSDDHLRVMEEVSRRAAMAIHNAMKFEETLEDSFTDPLTSLPNYRYLELYFCQELQKAAQYRHPLTIIVMDLDRFKETNDCFGHPAGDRLLVEVSKILKENLRDSDLVVRYAGDEFVAVMPQTDSTDAMASAKRVQEAVDGFRMDIRHGEYAQVGLSLGVASYPANGDTLAALISKADQDMYRDKGSRRSFTRGAGIPGELIQWQQPAMKKAL